MANDMIGAAKDLLLRESGPGPESRKMVEEKVRRDAVTRAIFESAARTIVSFIPFDMSPFIDDYAEIPDLQRWAEHTMKRRPDFNIGPDYMHRWHILPRNALQNVYLHHLLRSDEDVHHDHPWDNTSLVISGGFWEHIPDKPPIWRAPGDVIHRQAEDFHWLELPSGGTSVSLFFTGPKRRDWGFLCPDRGWVSWQEYTGGYHDGRSTKGRGCGEP